MLNWGKDAELDAMSQHDPKLTWYDVVIFTVIADLCLATICLAGYFVWDVLR